MFITEYQGILIIEGPYTTAKIIGPVTTTIDGFFENPQLRNLDDVKSRLAKIAEKLGANAVTEFKYGQKSATIWQSLFSRDDVHWYGSGLAVTVSDKHYNELLMQRR